MSESAAATSGWWLLDGPKAAARLGGAIAGRLQRGDAVCLSGPLGAGKSTLARGLIRALARFDEEAPSPTFTLAQTYDTAHLSLTHFDLYRLRSRHELEELGLEDALDHGAVVIEWPERLEAELPSDRLDIELRFAADGAANGRLARVTGHGLWIARASELAIDVADGLVRELG